MDTSMGFSALNGVPMGTRSGSIDPGVILYLMREKMGYAELEDLLYRKSGLLGVSGISNDMKVLQDSEDPPARAAVEFSAIASPGRWQRWRPRWAAWMRWCSLQASARTRRRSAP